MRRQYESCSFASFSTEKKTCQQRSHGKRLTAPPAETPDVLSQIYPRCVFLEAVIRPNFLVVEIQKGMKHMKWFISFSDPSCRRLAHYFDKRSKRWEMKVRHHCINRKWAFGECRFFIECKTCLNHKTVAHLVSLLDLWTCMYGKRYWAEV